MEDIYTPRFPIPRDMRIVAAGSCFAQHIGRQFKDRGYNFIDLEPPPPLFPPAKFGEFGFDLYSARYGNVYSARQLLQMFQRAYGRFEPEESAWPEKNGRVRDPFRPAIEPEGFVDRSEMEKERAYHLSRVRQLLKAADLFVFTFGLTEAWECIGDGTVLPTCPGTIGGTYDPERYRFKNFTFSEVMADAEAFIALALSENPDMKFLFTVSPVPLTATASGDHVLPATVYSKSILRAVCGELKAKYECVDYFPSFELVASHPMRALSYMPNLRAVAPQGVGMVMDTFFAAHGGLKEETKPWPKDAKSGKRTADPAKSDDVVCEEEILEVFGT